MCGIAGFIGPSGRPEHLRHMTKALTRRGPDDEVFYDGDGVGFGFRRLSIIDVEGGRQPIATEDGTIQVMLNGEIYGFQDVRRRLQEQGARFRTKSDSEVVLRAYQQWGEGCFRELNGMFAIAIWDGRERRLLLARDRMGKKPLYYTVQGETLWFASEPKALLAAGVLAPTIDPASLALYFRTDAVPTPRGIFQGLHKLEPATVLEWREGEIKRQWPFWHPPGASHTRMTAEEAVTSLRTAVDAAVRERLVSDVPLGIFLSGGIDSAVIAESAARQSTAPLRAYTIGFEDASHDERAAAAQVAKTFGMDHRVDVLSESAALTMLNEATVCLDEPLADHAMLPQLLLAQFARKEVTVAVAGDGGDELFLGYQHVPAHAWANRLGVLWALTGGARPLLNAIPSGQGYFSTGFKLQRLARGLGITDPWARDLAWRGAFTEDGLSALLHPDIRERAQVGLAEQLLAGRAAEMGTGRSFWQQWSWAYCRSYLLDNVMVKVDRATMWMSLEGRAPLLDTRVVEAAFQIPDQWKTGAWSQKRLLKELLNQRVPEWILRRPKHGFGVPTARWLSGPLAAELQAYTDPHLLKKQGLFEPTEVAQLIKTHAQGQKDKRKELWAYLMFQRWWRIWGT